MQNGFYIEAEKEHYYFGELLEDKKYNPLEYLHGQCDIFALALNDINKNKQMYGIFTNEHLLIHCFTINGNILEDVRGYTNCVEDFIVEFEDFISEYDFYDCLEKVTIKDIELLRTTNINKLRNSDLYKRARKIIHYYNFW